MVSGFESASAAASAGPASSVRPSYRVDTLWHPIAAIEDTPPGVRCQTQLLGRHIEYCRTSDHGGRAWQMVVGSGASAARPEPEIASAALHITEAYGYLWVCPGEPEGPLFALPEYAEADRRNVCAASVGVRASAPRAVENFLDMGHFPYVHTGILGEEPHTEVRDYDVAIDPDTQDILATRCRFYQPQAAAGASDGMIVDYTYRVPHPYCAILYKSCPSDESRLDVIALFVQPMTERTIRAHALVSVIDDDSTDEQIRMFQQTIFSQDKPILENQRPVRLPLDPRAETPIRADRSAIVYRRWLRDRGIDYGVIPAPA